MSFESLKSYTRGIGFKLNLWYASIFSGSALILCVLAYVVMSHALDQTNRETIQSHAKEYAAIYTVGGISALSQWFDQNKATERSFFVRILRPNNSLAYLTVPPEWVEFQTNTNYLGQSVPQFAHIRIPKDEERDLMIATVQLHDGWTMQVGRSTTSRKGLLLPISKSFLMVIATIAALAFTGGAFFAHRVMRPLREVISAAERIIATGNLEEHVPLRQSDDELDHLAHLFNEMLEKNRALIRELKGSLDNVAHDLRTPLTRLRGIAEGALRSENPYSMREALADSLEESDRVLTMLNAILSIAEADAGVMPLVKQTVNVTQLLREVLEVYQYVAEEKGVEIIATLDENLMAPLDLARMRQVFGNLLDNGIKYTDRGGRMDVESKMVGDSVVVTFRDNGLGISPEDLPRIWDRLYRGDKSRSQRGLGLGLSLVKAIVRAHEGTVSVTSEPGRGSVFEVSLPAR